MLVFNDEIVAITGGTRSFMTPSFETLDPADRAFVEAICRCLLTAGAHVSVIRVDSCRRDQQP